MKSSTFKKHRQRSQIFDFNRREVKHTSDRGQRFHFNSNQVMYGSECSQRFHFNSSEVKQSSERNQRFRFNGSEVNVVISVVRNVIVIVMNLNSDFILTEVKSKTVMSVVTGFILLYLNRSEVKLHN